MYWQPREAAYGGGVIDYDVINETFAEFASRLAGDVAEHNLRASAFVDRSAFADDVAIRIGRSAVDDVTTHLDTTSADTMDIAADGQWHSVLSQTIGNSPGGMVHVVGSVGTDIVAATATGAYFAIRVDGVVIMDTLTGSSENDQDAFDPAYVTSTGSSAPNVKVGHGGVVVDAIVPIEPGYHVLELVVLRRPVSGVVQALDHYYLKSRELIVLDIVG